MQIKYSIPATLLLYVFSLPLAFGQGLPPTNMGKFVHQPGDNQYSVQTQGERHGGGYFDTNGGPHVFTGNRSAGGGAAGGGPVVVRAVSPPPPKGPDVSIEPITADEPIAPAGFPPMPIAFDLPVGPSFSTGAAVSGTWRDGAPAPPGGGGGGAPGATGMHQHYAHFQPGAFQPGGGGSAPAAAGGPPADVAPAIAGGGSSSSGGGGGSGYYKCRTPPAITRTTDHYNVNNGGGGSAPPGYSGASAKDIKALGKAPDLDGSQDTGAPEAPSPVLINQTTTQDLSLPDDEFTSRYFKNGKTGRYVKQAARRGKTFGRQMLRSAGVPF